MKKIFKGGRCESRREGQETLSAELLDPVVLGIDAKPKGLGEKRGLFIWICRRAEEESRGSELDELFVSKGARGVELAAARKRRRRGGVEGRKRTSLEKKFSK